VREIRQDGYEMFRSIRRAHRPTEAIHDLIRGVVLEVYQVKKGSPLEGQSIAEADLRSKTGVMILAIQTDSRVSANPPPDTRFKAGDGVLLLGTAEQLALAAPLFSSAGADSPVLPEAGSVLIRIRPGGASRRPD